MSANAIRANDDRFEALSNDQQTAALHYFRGWMGSALTGTADTIRKDEINEGWISALKFAEETAK